MGDPDYLCTGSQHPCIRSAGPSTKQPVTKMSEYISFDLAGIDYTGLNQDGKRPSYIHLITVGQLQATAMR